MSRQRANEKKKEFAKMLFMETSMSQKDIAEKVGTSEQTLSKWATDEEWKLLRAAKHATIDSIQQKILNKINLLLEEQEVDADAIAKLAKQLRQNKELNAVLVTELFTKFTKWLVDKNSELAKKTVEYQDEFIRTFYV